MRPVLRNVWRWLGMVAAAGMLTVGCSLDLEPWPGWQGSGCTSHEACDDKDPCTKDYCDVYGVCQKDDIDGAGPDDGLQCTQDRCVQGQVVHPPTPGAPCGFSGNASCDSEGECVGCQAFTAEEDCGGPQYYCDFPVCRFKVGVGRPCTVADACTTQACTDGYCCDVPCGGTCESCNPDLTGGEPGVCGPVLGNLDPAGACAPFACDGAGACVGGNGKPCLVPADCLSNQCVDGVCCNSACNTSCRSCALPGLEGSCELVGLGEDPENECPGVTNCSGAGECALLAYATACTLDAECAGGSYCVDGVCCQSACAGLCVACNLPGFVGSCAPILAGQDPDAECVGAQVCNGGGLCQ